MKNLNIFNGNLSEEFIDKVVEKLCDPESYKLVYHRSNHDVPMPSITELEKAVDLLRSILMPGYYLNSELRPETMKHFFGATIDTIFRILSEQIKRGFCFSCAEDNDSCEDCESRAKAISTRFIEKIPELRRLLSLDALAAFEGDPAAKSIGETIFCYPSNFALSNHRIAHELYKENVPMIPRIISEMAHSRTGIDIHPGAQIGESFFIDHGTGTVIGETCIIGKNVRIYQGVTLGAKSFPVDESGNPIKGIARHPIVEDDVIIYSGATILGRVVIGKGSEIGGNVWLTHEVAPNSKILLQKSDRQ